jgi:hypothetical protein
LGLGDLVHGTFSFDAWVLRNTETKKAPNGRSVWGPAVIESDQPPKEPRGRRARPAKARVRVKNVRSGIEFMAVVERICGEF